MPKGKDLGFCLKKKLEQLKAQTWHKYSEYSISREGAKENHHFKPPPTPAPRAISRQLLNASLMSRRGSGFGSHSAGGCSCQGVGACEIWV